METALLVLTDNLCTLSLKPRSTQVQMSVARACAGERGSSTSGSARHSDNALMESAHSERSTLRLQESGGQRFMDWA